MASSQYGSQAPEVAEHSYPEVAPQQPQLHQLTPPTSYTLAASQPASQAPTTAGGYIPSPSDLYSPQKPHHAAAHYGNYLSPGAPIGGAKRPGRLSCTTLVFVLSTICAILAAAVVGLAVGTGVEANRANKAEASLAALSSSNSSQSTQTATSTSAAATATSFAAIDNKCSNQPDNVSGTTYTSFALLGQTTFTMHCNKDVPGDPLLSLFVADFNTCMDACSAYSQYEPTFFGTSNKNATCAGVSFIPLWTSKVNATAGGAPGNCYLKAGPQAAKNLTTPNIGTECHAAITTD